MRIFSKVAIVAMGLFLILIGCKDPVPDSLTVSPKEFTAIVAEGQTQDVTITSTVNWTVSGAQDWFTVNPASGGAGTTKVTITVKPNEKGDERNATLNFSGAGLSEKLTLKQLGAKILTVSTEAIEVDFHGETETVEVNATANWSASSSADWCKLNKTSGTASDVVNITVEENAGEARTAEITFTMGDVVKKIQVKQGAESLESILAKERKILEDFYRKANGDAWDNKGGWLESDTPVKKWYGITADNDGRVIEISFELNNLSGSISPEICKLKKLEKININMANLNESAIPENIGDLTELTHLVIKQSGLTGKIPVSIKNLKKLQVINLDGNLLTGELLAEMGELIDLVEISFSRNDFSGSVPDSWKNLSNLKRVYFNFNKKITGKMDVFLNCTNLLVLNLYNCGFSGEIGAGLGKLTKLVTINLAGNNFTGKLPKELVASPDINYFDVELNKLEGEIPAEILNHPKIDWTSKWHWRRICNQQQGYGFTNSPPNPEG